MCIRDRWLVNRNLIIPIRHLIGHVDQLSHGRFGQRVESNRQDELGLLARAANTLRDFLASTSERLHQSTQNLDSASNELNAIASRMTEGAVSYTHLDVYKRQASYSSGSRSVNGARTGPAS